MNQRAFNLAVGLIFLAVAVVHVLRIVFDWGAVIGGWEVPTWLSWVALLVAGFLAYEGFRFSRLAHR